MLPCGPASRAASARTLRGQTWPTVTGRTTCDGIGGTASVELPTSIRRTSNGLSFKIQRRKACCCSSAGLDRATTRRSGFATFAISSNFFPGLRQLVSWRAACDCRPRRSRFRSALSSSAAGSSRHLSRGASSTRASRRGLFSDSRSTSRTATRSAGVPNNPTSIPPVAWRSTGWWPNNFCR